MIKLRAVTDDDKRLYLVRLLNAWKKAPSLRLGQLLEDARSRGVNSAPLFYLEDTPLLDAVEALVAAGVAGSKAP